MRFQTIDVTQDGGIARVALNRPEVMNALNRTMRAEITAALTDLPQGTRCVVLTGTGRAFCSGQDLTDATGGFDVETILRQVMPSTSDVEVDPERIGPKVEIKPGSVILDSTYCRYSAVGRPGRIPGMKPP